MRWWRISGDGSGFGGGWTVWELEFAETNVSTDHDGPSCRVPEPISLSSRFVTDEDHRRRFGVPLLAFVIENPGPTAERSEMSDVRGVSIKELVRRSPF